MLNVVKKFVTIVYFLHHSSILGEEVTVGRSRDDLELSSFRSNKSITVLTFLVCPLCGDMKNKTLQLWTESMIDEEKIFARNKTLQICLWGHKFWRRKYSSKFVLLSWGGAPSISSNGNEGNTLITRDFDSLNTASVFFKLGLIFSTIWTLKMSLMHFSKNA